SRMALIGAGRPSSSGGTTARAAGRPESGELIELAGGSRVDRDAADRAAVDAPLVEDRLVAAVVDHRLQCGLDGLGERGALVDGDAVRRHVEGLAGELDLVLQLRDGVLRDRRVGRHGVGPAEGEGVARLILAVELEDVDGGLAGIRALL